GKVTWVALNGPTGGPVCAGRYDRYRSNTTPSVSVSRAPTRQRSDAYRPVVQRPFSDADGDWNRMTSDGAPRLRTIRTSFGTWPSPSCPRRSWYRSLKNSPPALKLWLPAQPSLK